MTVDIETMDRLHRRPNEMQSLPKEPSGRGIPVILDLYHRYLHLGLASAGQCCAVSLEGEARAKCASHLGTITCCRTCQVTEHVGRKVPMAKEEAQRVRENASLTCSNAVKRLQDPQHRSQA